MCPDVFVIVQPRGGKALGRPYSSLPVTNGGQQEAETNLCLLASTLSLLTKIFLSFTDVFKLLFFLMMSFYEAFGVNQSCAFGVMRYKRDLVETILIFS